MKTFDVKLDAQLTINYRVRADDEQDAVIIAINELEFDVVGADVYNARPVTIVEV